ncbi:uncharacterized protein [Primulina huaijiensis]|uniref:uncharacterized protein n=1 Tax=Primulina huaijiensis TaxID=1492673 RepID=UPI003CC6F167
MLSFNTSERILSAEEALSKKRKRDEEKLDKTRTMKSFLEADLESHSTPLPLEWQRCLDVKSGQVYFLNTRTKLRALTDPRLSAEPSPNPTPMSLDLELNPPSQHLRKNHFENNSDKHDIGRTESSHSNDPVMISSTRNYPNNRRLNHSPSWLSFEVDDQEMVTAVCSKCYILVMMCKSSPSCPNCKYMHITDTREHSSRISG